MCSRRAGLLLARADNETLDAAKEHLMKPSLRRQAKRRARRPMRSSCAKAHRPPEQLLDPD